MSIPIGITKPRTAGVYAAVAAGGAIGACARWAIADATPVRPLEFPTSTLLINVVGCLLMGALMAYLPAGPRPRRAPPHVDVQPSPQRGPYLSPQLSPYLRPFLGVGVLGGFTTVSTFALETSRLLTHAGGLGLAVVYLVLTPVLAVVAVIVGHRFGEALVERPAAVREQPGGES